jgi:preprotein translocase SecE subunit
MWLFLYLLTYRPQRGIMHVSPPGWFLIRGKNNMNKTIEYIKEVKAEMKHVTWPSRNQTMFFTVAVLLVSALIAYFLGFFDFVFSRGLEWILTR